MSHPSTTDRYARHRLIPWWDQELLKQSTVLVAGAGATGNEVIKLLALAGIGRILIIDFDRIEQTNLTRSVLYRDGDVGEWKAHTAARRARELNPEIRALAACVDLEFEIGIGTFREANIAIGCLDSINARLALNRQCCAAGIPWIDTGIEAGFCSAAFYCGTSVNPETDVCFECTMSESMWERRNQRYSCTGMPADITEAPAPTTAAIASTAAALAVQEAIVQIHHAHTSSAALPRPLQDGDKVTVTFSPYHMTVMHQSRLPDCMAHNRMDPQVTVTDGPQQLSALQLMQLCKVELADTEIELGFDLLTELICTDCGQRELINRPVERVPETAALCPACGKHTRRPDQICRIGAADPQAVLPLSQLSIPSQQVLCIKGAHGRKIVQVGGVSPFNAD
jgi:molybdopterin/thiamine biosynthesis adenylyltransferase